MKHSFRTLLTLLLAPLATLVANAAPESAKTPNILLIYADDLGYGDVGCNGATAVKTPNVDRLAREGLRFTSGYCSSSTCTPSRYSMLTGEYAFRKNGTGVLRGDAALIIPTDRVTLPGVLKQAGYATGIVGKWHLGLGAGQGALDWNAEIKPGPREVGFDYSTAGREHFLEHSVSIVAIRQGQWKFIPAPSGPKAEGKRAQQGDQLYDLAKDLGESKNVASEHRDLVAELSAKLAQLREQGRSRP